MALKRLLQSALAFILIGGAVTLAQAPAQAVGEVYGPYILVDAATYFSGSPQCLADPHGSTGNNVTMIIYGCEIESAQTWDNETPVSPSDYWTFNESSFKCLGPLNGSKSSGVSIIQTPCTNGASDRWNYQYIGEGGIYGLQIGNTMYNTTKLFKIKDIWSGLCLSVKDGSTGSSTPLVQLGCNNDISNEWLQFPI